jgi:PHP family Zn ribbon phosphoesterase
MVIGVMSRVEALATQPSLGGHQIPYKSVVGLDDVIAESIISKGRKTKRVTRLYEELIKKFGSELHVLLYVDQESLQKNTLPEIAEGIKRNRDGVVRIVPGYDGVYGRVSLFNNEDRERFEQARLL